MINEDKITDRQLAYLIYSGAVTNMLFMVHFVFLSAGRATFIATMLGGLITALLLLWVISLGNLMPGKSIFDMITSVYGKVFSNFLIIVYSLFHIVTAALMLRLSVSLFIKIFILHLTPLWLIALMPVIMIGIFLYTDGIGTFAKWNLIIMVVATMIYFVGIMIGMATKFDIDKILPIFHVEWSDFLYGIFLMASVLSETVIKSFCIVGAIRDYKKSYKGLFKGVCLYIPITSTAVFFALGIMGLGVARGSAFAVFDLAHEIGVGEFIQGLEIFHILPFVSLIYMGLGYKAYCSLLGILTISKNKKHRLIYVLLICIGIYIITLSISSFNVAMLYMQRFISYTVFPFCLFFLILATIAVIINKFKSRSYKT
ncbi:MAG: spore germination protein [Clostridia bacterium]|nr:spore germination protein [Clostridia bacterium]